MTKEQARKDLSMWLALAAQNPIFNKYDRLCRGAYDVLGKDEYGKIYNTWAKTYVSCNDGYARRR